LNLGLQVQISFELAAPQRLHYFAPSLRPQDVLGLPRNEMQDQRMNVSGLVIDPGTCMVTCVSIGGFQISKPILHSEIQSPVLRSELSSLRGNRDLHHGPQNQVRNKQEMGDLSIFFCNWCWHLQFHSLPRSVLVLVVTILLCAEFLGNNRHCQHNRFSSIMFTA
jgi:hypothetical protein